MGGATTSRCSSGEARAEKDRKASIVNDWRGNIRTKGGELGSQRKVAGRGCILCSVGHVTSYWGRLGDSADSMTGATKQMIRITDRNESIRNK